MELLRFRVVNQHITGGRYRPVSGSIDYIEAVFDFTPDWNGLDKWAHFSKGETVYDVNLIDDRITRDMHLNLDAGMWEVKLHGDANENGEVAMRITTDTAYITVEDFGKVHEGGILPEISADSASQIAAKAQEAIDIANSVKAAAEAGEFDGEKGEKGDPGDSLLPEITAEDNGKIVAVQEGRYILAEQEEGAFSWNELLDKPFYTEENAVIFEGQFADELIDTDGDGENDSWNNMMFLNDDSEATLVLGKTYTVIWNGEEYKCLCKNFQGLPVIGNYEYIGGENSGEPFALARDENDLLGAGSVWAAVLINPPDIAESCIYSCKILGEKIKPLDEKYIPAPKFFDLGKMGIQAIPIDGGKADLETDTSEIAAALGKGAVTFGIPLEAYESVFTMYFTTHGLSDGESNYLCMGFAGMDAVLAVMIMIIPERIMLEIAPLGTVIGIPEASEADNGKIMKIENGVWTAAELTEKAVPSAVDLSVFESEGVITENYPDGSTVTYSFKFDSEGNPTKITDSSGNETVLTW